MAQTTNGMPVPEIGDSNNPPADLLAMGNAVDAFYGGAVANVAALAVSGDFPGQRKFLTDTGEVATWNGTEWTGYTKTYTPVVDNASATATASYVRDGNWVTVRFFISFTGALTSTLLLSKPVDAVATGAVALGSAIALDGGVSGTRRSLTVINESPGNVFFIVDSLTSAATITTGTPWTWASGDTVGGTFKYLAE